MVEQYVKPVPMARPIPPRSRAPPPDMETGPGLISGPHPEPPHPVRIRLEAPGDEPGIRRVHERAFAGPEEAAIVDEIRRTAPEGWQSIAAVDETGVIVGHVLLSPCPVEDDDGGRGVVLAIGPIGVLPELQSAASARL